MSRMGTDASCISPAMLSLIATKERSARSWSRSKLRRWWCGAIRIASSRRLVDGLMELHPACEFRTVDGIGHLLPLETPQMYVELVQTGWAAGPNAPWAALRHRTTHWTPDCLSEVYPREDHNRPLAIVGGGLMTDRPYVAPAGDGRMSATLRVRQATE